MVPFYNLNGKIWIPSTPWEAGEYEGKQWAKTARATSLRNAAERMTTNELIEQHIRRCIQWESTGQSYIGDLKVTPPSECASDPEVRGFFRNLVAESQCYQGNDPNIKIGKYKITRVPGHNLRKFEDGWTTAVRKHWSQLRQAQS